jgi:hypothetical protein
MSRAGRGLTSALRQPVGARGRRKRKAKPMRAGSALASSPRPLPKDGDGWVVPARRFWSAVLHPAACRNGVVGTCSSRPKEMLRYRAA